MSSSIKKPLKFTIRVYGIVINKGKILVSDEVIQNNKYTKFPGGGVEFGEGLIESLKREFLEELNAEFLQFEHFYTLEPMVISAFDPSFQVMAIYYLVTLKNPDKVKVVTKKFNFEKLENNTQALRWVELKNLKTELFELLPDKLAVEKLLVTF